MMNEQYSNRRREATKALVKQQKTCVGMVINCSDSSRLQRAVMSKLADPTVTMPGRYTAPHIVNKQRPRFPLCLKKTLTFHEMVHVLALRKDFT
jgi:hypothetical protein